MRTLAKKMLSDSAWAIGMKFGAGLAQIFVTILLSKFLTLETFGEFQVLQRVFIFGSILCAGGFGWVVFRFISEGVVSSNRVHALGTLRRVAGIFLIYFSLYSILFGFFGGIIIEKYFHISLATYEYQVIAVSFFLSIQRVIPEFFRAMGDIRYASLFGGLAYNCVFCIVILFGIVGLYSGSIINIVDAYLVAMTITVSLSVLIAYKIFNVTLPNNRYVADKKSVSSKVLSHTAFLILLSELIIFLIKESNVWIASALYSNELAGHYAVATRITFLLTVPLVIANAVLKPTISKMWIEKDLLTLQSILQRVALLLVVITTVTSIPFIFYAENTLGFIFGAEYSSSSRIVTIVAIGHIVNAFFGTCSAMLLLGDGQRSMLSIMIVGVIVYIASLFIFIPMFDELGLAYSLVLAQIVYQGGIALRCKTKLKVSTFANLCNLKK